MDLERMRREADLREREGVPTSLDVRRMVAGVPGARCRGCGIDLVHAFVPCPETGRLTTRFRCPDPACGHRPGGST